jgi:hypothetical protein
MSEDDDKIIRLNQLRNNPLFGAHQQRKAERPPINSTKESNEWVDRYHSVSIIVGKFFIIKETDDGDWVLMSKKDFIDSLENNKLSIIGEDGNPKSTACSKLWLEWPNRRTYELGIVFDPKWKFDSKTMRSGAYNTWRGFAIPPIKGDCPLIMDFIKNIICSGDDKHFHYATCWIAQMFQEPWNKLGTSMVLRGLKGIGKSYLAKILGMLMNGKPGQERRQKLYITIDNRNSIFGNHNDHLENIILLCWEEAMWAGDKAHESTFKHIVSGTELFVNPKNLPGRNVRNYIRSIIIGNADWIVPASFDERRFFVMNVSSAHKDDRDYFDKLDEELLDRGGLEAFMYHLMNYNYSDVNLRTALVTEALIEQKTESMTGVERWWFNMLVSGQLPFIHLNEKGYLVVKEKLYQDFLDVQRRLGDKNRIDQRSFGMRFVALIPKLDESGKEQHYPNGKVISIVGVGDKYTSEKERLNVYIIPKLNVCRKLMDIKLKSNFGWSNDADEWEFPTFTERNIMSRTNLF